MCYKHIIKKINNNIYEYFNDIVVKMEILEKHKINNIITEFGILENKFHIDIIPIILLLISKNLLVQDKYECQLFNQYNSIILDTNTTENKINCNLIVVSDHMIHKWHNELKLIDIKFFIIDINTKISNLDIYQINQYDIVLCISSKYNKLITYMNATWNRIIIDKVDIINKCNAYPKFNFLWLISSDISKSKSWIKIYLDTINNNIFLNNITIQTTNQIIIDTLQIKYNISEYFYKKSIVNDYTGYNIDKYKQLNDIQKLLYNNNIDYVFKKLNGNIIYKNDLTLEILQEFILKYDSTNKRQLVSIEGIYSNKCYICLDNIKNPVLISCCINMICFDCIIEILFKDNITNINNNCPLCRQCFNFKDLILIKDNTINSYKYNKQLNYSDNINSILINNKDKKILIFTLNDIIDVKNLIKTKNFSFNELKGNYKNISNIIFKYNTTTQILIINHIINIYYLYDIYTTDIFIYDSNIDIELINIIINKIYHYKRAQFKKLEIYKLTGQDNKI